MMHQDSGWISVVDHLPDNDVVVLAMGPLGGVFEARRSGDGWAKKGKPCKVSMWMPLQRQPVRPAQSEGEKKARRAERDRKYRAQRKARMEADPEYKDLVNERNRENGRKQREKKLELMQADPVARETELVKRREYEKRRWERIKSDPEYRARYNMQKKTQRERVREWCATDPEYKKMHDQKTRMYQENRRKRELAKLFSGVKT